MPLPAGSRLGPYEIVSPIGAGGMGEVYRGRDTRLGRDVAIKILPSGFAQNEEFRARFEREARTISSLNHPNICTLFDVGQQDGMHYLVMELIEGESLVDRLSKGPLPLDQVLRYGAQVAEALGRAHRQGIVHRDLKPGNVMLTKTGAKLLDFGLARSGPDSAPIQGLTEAATRLRPLTQEGAILGTFQYMAPEQLEGIEADARTDIFSYGALLYEMATGKRAFEGATRTSLIAAIVSGTPRPMGELVPLTPPALEHVIRRCLAKDPDERWQNATDVGNQLRWISEAGSRAGEAAPVAARRRSRLHTAWWLHLVTAMVAVLATLGVASLRRPAPALIRTSVLPPEDTRFEPISGAAALSPDGREFAFVASGEDGKSALWVRGLDALAARKLEGTEGASHPFWSPDGRQLGFFHSGKLKRIDASGAPPQVICDAPAGRGGTWGPQNTILFTPTPGDPIFSVPAAGGTPVQVTDLDTSRKETSHRFAEFLPDGRSFLYLVEAGSDSPGTDLGFSLFAGSLDSKERHQVVATNTLARYSPTGHLLYLRAGALIAQPFDPETATLSGEGVQIADRIRRTGRFEAAFSLARNGLLLYQVGSNSEPTRLDWADRAGRTLGTFGGSADMRGIRLSHDAGRVACAIVDPTTQKTDVWVLDVARGTSTKLTFDPENDANPIWSADDSKIYFTGSRKDRGDLYVKSSFGTGTDQHLFGTPTFDQIQNVDPDGVSAWIMTIATGSQPDILRLSLQTGKAESILNTPFSESQPAPSPDGRWLAYISDESGRNEVYVQSLGQDGGKWQISSAGGTWPTWTRGGRELIFQGRDNRLMAVTVQPGPVFSAGLPAALFEPQIRTTFGGRSWDVTADGERFLLNRPLGDSEVEPLSLVQNWAAALNR